MRLVYQINADANLKDLLGMVYEIYAEIQEGFMTKEQYEAQNGDK